MYFILAADVSVETAEPKSGNRLFVPWDKLRLIMRWV